MNQEYEFLHEYPLFAGLSEEQMQAIMQVCREECFVPDVTLYEEGQAAAEIFVLVEGEVEEAFTAGEAVLTLIHPTGPGEIIGCSALLPPSTHRCTARSLTRLEVLAIDAVGLQKLFEEDCQLAVSIQQQVIRALLDRIGKLRLAGTEYA
ncbi:MAG: cyclic nucleotide-binding domain-containing protein [Chloroflexota bacterium]|jgi:signal-transduction protein with cAMP-binding, CBS, and nucleotidyltransferase domain